MPFLFGATARKLKERYFLRVVTPRGVAESIRLQAYPRFQQQLADFDPCRVDSQRHPTKLPEAVQLGLPDGCRSVYLLKNIVVNDPLIIFKNPFKPTTGFGWKMVADTAVPQWSAGPVMPPAIRQ